MEWSGAMVATGYNPKGSGGWLTDKVTQTTTLSTTWWGYSTNQRGTDALPKILRTVS
jgi:hypothetical protein